MSLLSARGRRALAVTAAAGQVEAHDVAGLQRDARLRGDGHAVHDERARGARLTAEDALGRDGEPAASPR